MQTGGLSRPFAWFALVSRTGEVQAIGQLPDQPADYPRVAAQSELDDGRTAFLLSDGTPAQSQIAVLILAADGTFTTRRLDRGSSSLVIDGHITSDGTALATWRGPGQRPTLGILTAAGNVSTRE